MKRCLFILLLCGCAGPISQHGIPNFRQVDAGIYRGGQPTAEGFAYLRHIGVTNIIKLNCYCEGAENISQEQRVACYPISTWQQLGLAKINDGEIAYDAFLLNRPGTFLHCTHGQDRTGIAVATYRCLYDGWTKQQAEQEMKGLGFHSTLFGLKAYWNRFNP